MNSLIDLALNHGAVGALAAVLIVAAVLGYRHWRDLISERDFWRDTAWKALRAGEAIADRPGEDDG